MSLATTPPPTVTTRNVSRRRPVPLGDDAGGGGGICAPPGDCDQLTRMLPWPAAKGISKRTKSTAPAFVFKPDLDWNLGGPGVAEK